MQNQRVCKTLNSIFSSKDFDPPHLHTLQRHNTKKMSNRLYIFILYHASFQVMCAISDPINQ
jgi:hypothetical protein